MLSRVTLSIALICFAPYIFNAQEKPKKEKFIPEKTLHFKVGTTLNYVNTHLYGILNSVGTSVFTPIKNPAFNLSAEIEFDNQFAKHFGINLALGFMQTRHYYHFESVNSTLGYNGLPVVMLNPDGLILCNVPHINMSPSFYIRTTRFNVGLGYYKYYYAFKPASIGQIYFDLNSEGMMFYSTAGITQSINLKGYVFTVSANYFGLTKKYDHGLQLALGIAL